MLIGKAVTVYNLKIIITTCRTNKATLDIVYGVATNKKKLVAKQCFTPTLKFNSTRSSKDSTNAQTLKILTQLNVLLSIRLMGNNKMK
jgi:hypothetical protein